eukprot:TRINITY_DN7456_c0_g1_i1.p1 TRINITY_DN7456_c0_g1~~TRINITY_DN7456_c0_g1_i1.p1  ORF type:complete len:255 (+),score=42.12 TRINITY_DN7456_c0_g1_i1:35-799(+)
MQTMNPHSAFLLLLLCALVVPSQQQDTRSEPLPTKDCTLGGGVTRTSGERFSEDCNMCTCLNGEVTCTELDCSTSGAVFPREIPEGAKADRDTSSEAKADRGTSSEAKADRGTSSEAKADRDTSSEAKADRDTSSEAKADRGTSSEAKADRDGKVHRDDSTNTVETQGPRGEGPPTDNTGGQSLVRPIIDSSSSHPSSSPPPNYSSDLTWLYALVVGAGILCLGVVITLTVYSRRSKAPVAKYSTSKEMELTVV